MEVTPQFFPFMCTYLIILCSSPWKCPDVSSLEHFWVESAFIIFSFFATTFGCLRLKPWTFLLHHSYSLSQHGWSILTCDFDPILNRTCTCSSLLHVVYHFTSVMNKLWQYRMLCSLFQRHLFLLHTHFPSKTIYFLTSLFLIVFQYFVTDRIAVFKATVSHSLSMISGLPSL